METLLGLNHGLFQAGGLSENFQDEAGKTLPSIPGNQLGQQGGTIFIFQEDASILKPNKGAEGGATAPFRGVGKVPDSGICVRNPARASTLSFA